MYSCVCVNHIYSYMHINTYKLETLCHKKFLMNQGDILMAYKLFSLLCNSNLSKYPEMYISYIYIKSGNIQVTVSRRVWRNKEDIKSTWELGEGVFLNTWQYPHLEQTVLFATCSSNRGIRYEQKSCSLFWDLLINPITLYLWKVCDYVFLV